MTFVTLDLVRGYGTTDYTLLLQENRIMSAPVVAGLCGLFCMVAIYVAWKVYKDTREMKRKIEDDNRHQ